MEKVAERKKGGKKKKVFGTCERKLRNDTELLRVASKESSTLQCESRLCGGEASDGRRISLMS
jgi:hypothetical protein